MDWSRLRKWVSLKTKGNKTCKNLNEGNKDLDRQWGKTNLNLLTS